MSNQTDQQPWICGSYACYFTDNKATANKIMRLLYQERRDEHLWEEHDCELVLIFNGSKPDYPQDEFLPDYADMSFHWRAPTFKRFKK